LTDENAEKFFEGLQRAPLGIITLEDVLEELIGEEILDEFDLKGANALAASTYVPAEAQRAVDAAAAKNAAEAKMLEANAKSAPPVLSGTNTPTNGSTTNLRVAQGLRAIRMATTNNTNPKPTKRSSSAPGTKRGSALSPLSGTISVSAAPSRAETPAPPPVEDGASASSGGATVVGDEKDPRPGAPVVGGGGAGTSTLPTVPQGFTIAPGVATEDGATIPKPGTPKKRAFKSLIAGEGATPGLEKRSDPLAKEGGKSE